MAAARRVAASEFLGALDDQRRRRHEAAPVRRAEPRVLLESPAARRTPCWRWTPRPGERSGPTIPARWSGGRCPTAPASCTAVVRHETSCAPTLPDARDPRHRPRDHRHDLHGLLRGRQGRRASTEGRPGTAVQPAGHGGVVLPGDPAGHLRQAHQHRRRGGGHGHRHPVHAGLHRRGAGAAPPRAAAAPGRATRIRVPWPAAACRAGRAPPCPRSRRLKRRDAPCPCGWA